jgi:hypothetical protein
MSLWDKEEWFEKLKDRYRKAGRVRKSQLLDEITEIHGCHRKSLIRALRARPRGRKSAGKGRGRPSKYDIPEFIKALRLVWKKTDFMCSCLLHAAMSEWVPSVERHCGEFSDEVRALLYSISTATIDRNLKPYKGKFKGGTKPGSLLKNEIAIQGSVWDIEMPGFMEADTVAHCGTSMGGLFIWSLTLTDIATQWTECRAVWHKAASGIVAQIKDIEVSYFSEKRRKYIDFAFTRSRPNQKNDNAHVEQKNWTHPRRLFGRERLDVLELVPLMNDLYSNEFSLLRNHFYPNLKLEQKIMIKSRYKRLYGDPRTPYQRVLQSPHIADDVKHRLVALHATLDPIDLADAIHEKLHTIQKSLKQARSIRISA